MKRLGVRVDRVRASLPEPPTSATSVDTSRLTTEQIVRMAELQERWLAVGLAGLTYEELEEIIALQEILTAPGPGEG